MSRRARHPVVPHACPANPSNEHVTVSVAGLRSAGLGAEADRLEQAIRTATLWGNRLSENTIALTTWGCCRHAALAAASRYGRPESESPGHVQYATGPYCRACCAAAIAVEEGGGG